VSRRNPIDEIEQLFDRMSSELAAVGDELEPPFRPRPSVDVATRDDEVIVVVDLPGFEPDDVEVSLLDRELHVVADRDDRFDESATLHRRERRQRVERRIRLPEPVVDDETTAEYEHGVLTVTLPTPDSDTVDDTTIEVN
jgi:HSP20 family protein